MVTGNSMGAVASFIANGVDDRIQGILTVNGGGALAGSAAAGSWMGRLLQQATGRPATDPQVKAYFAALDPLSFAERQHGAVYMLGGAQDEFFPLPQLLTTFNRIRAPAKSLALVADYDHQWYFGTGCTARCMPGAPTSAATWPASVRVRRRAARKQCPPGQRWPYCGPHASYNRSEEAVARWGAAVASAGGPARRHPRRAFGPPPPAPIVKRKGDDIQVTVSGPQPRAVRLAISDNGGFTWGQVLLRPTPMAATAATTPASASGPSCSPRWRRPTAPSPRPRRSCRAASAPSSARSRRWPRTRRRQATRVSAASTEAT